MRATHTQAVCSPQLHAAAEPASQRIARSVSERDGDTDACRDAGQHAVTAAAYDDGLQCVSRCMSVRVCVCVFVCECRWTGRHR